MKDFEGRIEVIYDFPFPKKWKWESFKSLLRNGSSTKKILVGVRKNVQRKSGSLILPQNFWLTFSKRFQTKIKENHNGWFFMTLVLTDNVSMRHLRATRACANRVCSKYLKHMCISFTSITSDQCSSLNHLGVWRNTIHDLNPPIFFFDK